MLQVYDYAFTIFHTVFILFVLFGWVHPKTRKAHQISLLFTLVAWLALGLYLGLIGYCPLTDWQWDIKRELGVRNLPSSFTEYILETLTGFDFKKAYVDIATALGLIFGIVMAGVKFWQARAK